MEQNIEAGIAAGGTAPRRVCPSVVIDRLKGMLLAHHLEAVMEVGDVFSLPQLSRSHLAVQRSTPTPSFNLESDGGNIVAENATGPCFFTALQTATFKARTLRQLLCVDSTSTT